MSIFFRAVSTDSHPTYRTIAAATLAFRDYFILTGWFRFGSCPLVVVAAVFADIYDNKVSAACISKRQISFRLTFLSLSTVVLL